MSPNVEALEAELAALRRRNEQLSELAEHAIRMGEKLLEPAREAISAYDEYARLAADSAEEAEPAARRLAEAMDKLSRLVGSAKPPRRDRRSRGRRK